MARASASLSQEWRRDPYVISTDPSRLQIDIVHDFLLQHSYWARDRTREALETAVAHSRCYGLYNMAGVQIGFARCVTDFATFAYLADVFIVPEEQGHGLGQWLVSCVLADPALRHVRRWTLYTLDAQTLYTRFGFEAEPQPDKHMVLRRPASF